VPERSAQRLVDGMAGIEAGPALDGLAARRLAALCPEEAAEALADLLGRASLDPLERKALQACTRALVWGEPELPEERRRAIRVAAASLGFGSVAALFSGAEAARPHEPEPPYIDPGLASLTLGHRKQFARTETDPDRIARFSRDDDPTVIQNLLLNPRMTEALVVRIAARRPATAEVLSEVARSAKWGVRYSVKKALALNPHAPPALVNPILPHLTSADLKELSVNSVLHPAVRTASRALLAARGD
jgi:hypothetical protein